MRSWVLTATLLAVFACFSFVPEVVAQQSPGDYKLLIEGALMNSSKERLKDATVTLSDWDSGKQLSTVQTKGRGKFAFYLSFNGVYKVHIAREGYHDLFLQINTHNVPVDNRVFGYEFGGFTVQMSALEEVEGTPEWLKLPMARIYYEPEFHGFDYDKNWAQKYKHAREVSAASQSKEE